MCDYCMEPTEDLSLLLEEWPELLEPVRKLVQEQNFREPVNCIFAVPSCMYTGPVRISNPQGGTLWFVGNMKEGAFSDSVAEDYNIQVRRAGRNSRISKNTACIHLSGYRLCFAFMEDYRDFPTSGPGVSTSADSGVTITTPLVLRPNWEVLALPAATRSASSVQRAVPLI